MSHQTGIGASAGLKEFLATAKVEGNVRLIKIGIDKEELVKLDHRNIGKGTWETEYDTTVLSVLEEKQPCYILYRLDSKNNLGWQWLFIPYSPDFAEVRQKMLFAATKATLKIEFGGGLILDELYGTTTSDVSLDGYKKHLESANAPAPLSMREEEMKEIKQNELNLGVAATTKSATLPGISFPIEDDAITALIAFSKNEVDFVHLSVDVTNEIIRLEKSCNMEIDQLVGSVPTDTPSYVFFLFKHTHEGDFLKSPVFIYCMPGYQCSVKDRMMYSSCKAPLLSGLQSVLGLECTKKMEISEPSELTAEFLQDECHPKKDIVRQKFAKPKGPGGRGPKRMMRPSDTE